MDQTLPTEVIIIIGEIQAELDIIIRIIMCYTLNELSRLLILLFFMVYIIICISIEFYICIEKLYRI